MLKIISKYKKFLLRFSVSAVALFLTYRTVEIDKFWENLKLVDLTFAPLIIIFLVLNYIVSSIRWKYLLIYKNSEKADVGYLTSLYFIGSFFNNIMPTSIGGDAYKVFKLGKRISSYTNAFSATFMERFTGVLVLVFISLISLSVFFKWGIVLIFLWVFMGLVISFKLLKALSKKIKVLGKIYNSLSQYKGQNKIIFWAVITSFLVQLIAIFTQYFVFLSLGIKLPVLYSLFVFPIITLASFFIPSINGIGIQDFLYKKIFLFAGVPEVVSLSASILYHLFRLLVSLIGGVLLAFGKDS